MKTSRSKHRYLELFVDETDMEGEIQVRQEQNVGIRLRPYQKEAADAVFREWETVQSTLVCKPTGTGKSVLFSEVMRRWMDGR